MSFQNSQLLVLEDIEKHINKLKKEKKAHVIICGDLNVSVCSRLDSAHHKDDSASTSKPSPSTAWRGALRGPPQLLFFEMEAIDCDVPWYHKSGFSLTPLGTPDSEQMGTRLKADSGQIWSRLNADSKQIGSRFGADKGSQGITVLAHRVIHL